MSQTDLKYIPTGTTPQLVIQSLNDYLGQELSLCGPWSPTIFYSDLRDYPVSSKRRLAELVHRANQLEQKGPQRMSYLEFFELSRGEPRPNTTESQKQIWEIFEQGSVMLYFEPIFLRLIGRSEGLSKFDQVTLLYIKALSQAPVVQWNKILEGLGACCYQFFGKEPDLYAQLVYRTEDKSPEMMTDQEMLDAIGSKLSPTSYRGRISIDDCRSALIRRYQASLEES